MTSFKKILIKVLNNYQHLKGNHTFKKIPEKLKSFTIVLLLGGYYELSSEEIYCERKKKNIQ